jgi:hypothetical protein
MSDVQIAVIDQQDTQIALAVPGIQGAVGPAFPANAIPDGTAAAPGVAFTNDPDTGIFRPGANRFAFTTGGVLRNEVNEQGDFVYYGDAIFQDGSSFQTTLQTVTPTVDRTISFPDATGTVALVAGSSGQVIFNNAGVQAGGNLGYNATTGVFGYINGTGTVTQATNKATGVTLNSPSGQITLNGDALAADTTVSFTLTNSSITANDILILNHLSAGTAGSYLLNAQADAGSASINVRNITAGSLSEAIVIGFAVIKTP